MSPDYNYESAGFDAYLSRSIDNVGQSAPQAMQVNFDQNQISGSLGDTLRIGSIFLDGKAGSIVIYDDQGVPVAIFGELN